MNLYLKNGYLDMKSIRETGFPFIFIAAARGTGKTYGGLKDLYELGKPIIQLRRTQKEADLQSIPDGTSYKKIFDNLGIEYSVKKVKDVGIVYDNTNDKEVCYNLALSTVATIRGFDFSEIKHVFYDEFIAESHVKKMKHEGMAFANFYESVNRNRELEGHQPLQVICAANSVNMANDIFMYFDLIQHAEELINRQEDYKIIGNKLLIIPQHSPISEKKSSTALYKAVNSEFSDMAISNKFILNDQSYVKNRNLTEYRCSFRIGDLYFYQHKTKKHYYVTFQKGQCSEEYPGGYAGLKQAKRAKWRFVSYYLDGKIFFESYRCIALFEKYFDI